jgi:integrase
MPFDRNSRDSIWIDARPDSPNLYLCWYDSIKRKVKWKSCRTADRTEAERQKATMLITGAASAAFKANPAANQLGQRELTLFAVLDYYWEEYAQYLPSHERNLIAINHFKTFFGDVVPLVIDRKNQQRYVDARDALSIAPATISTEFSTLRAALYFAEDEFGIAIPRIFDVERGESEKLWLTPEQIEKLLEACRSSHIRLFMRVARETGARPSAILDLKFDQVDFDQCRIRFNPNGRTQTSKKKPIVPISTDLRDELIAARKLDAKNAKRKNRPLCDYVISYGGYPVGSVKKAFRDTAAEAGLVGVTPYTIRHSVATWMAKEGVSFFKIARYLGTSVKMIEETYAHHHPDFLRDAHEAVQKSIGKPKAEPLALRKDRPTRKELMAERKSNDKGSGQRAAPDLHAETSAPSSGQALAPQLHHKIREIAESRLADTRRKTPDFCGKAMVGGTGIEPVTPTMST